MGFAIWILNTTKDIFKHHEQIENNFRGVWAKFQISPLRSVMFAIIDLLKSLENSRLWPFENAKKSKDVGIIWHFPLQLLWLGLNLKFAPPMKNKLEYFHISYTLLLHGFPSPENVISGCWWLCIERFGTLMWLIYVLHFQRHHAISKKSQSQAGCLNFQKQN